jgi:AbiV family abortive infection protein
MNLKELLRTSRTGQLSVEEIGRGMHKSFKNASELIEDADLLISHRPARAISLAVLALEEIAKVILLANAAARAATSAVSWKDIEDDLNLRSHNHKQTVFAAYGSLILNKMDLDECKSTYYGEIVPQNLTPLLDCMKQCGFYVDNAFGQFISPTEFGDENREWADWLITVVKERLKSFEPLHETEEKSIIFAQQVSKFWSLLSEASDDNQYEHKIREFFEYYKLNMNSKNGDRNEY